MTALKISSVVTPLLNSKVYLIEGSGTADCYLVDIGDYACACSLLPPGAQVSGVFITHGHMDHMSGLHALVLEGGAAEHRLDLAVDRGLAKRAHDLLDRELLAGEELLQERVVRLGGALDHLLAPLLRLVGELGGDFALDHLEAVAGLVEAQPVALYG